MTVAFLITSPYQVFHYRQIAPHLGDVVALLEARDQDYGLSEQFVRERMPGCEIRWVARERLTELDGQYAAIVCQTPILPLEFLSRSYVVAQQYSLAKERYQYGVWRAHAALNLMYGAYSVSKVEGFCHAVPVGNPLLDGYFQQGPSPRKPIGSAGRRPRLLYQPTYGELSSIGSVLARLRQVDADITVKLHHADDPDRLGEAFDGLRVVGAEADPAALLREHDGVISDFSGAAFDALYAGLPVVLAGQADASVRDYQRLSDQERDLSLLRGVAEPWPADRDLFEAFAAAEHLLDSPAYKEFLSATFVNPGSAGPVGAREIRRLIEEGPPAHFGAEQVRETTQRYITRNRELSAGQARKSPLARSTTADLKLVYRRSRRLLARSRLLRGAVHRARAMAYGRRLRSQPPAATGPVPAAVPAERREEITALLAGPLAAAGVRLARAEEAPGSPVAMRVTAKRQIYEVLRQIGSDRPDLRVRVGVDWQIVEALPLDRLRFSDIVSAHWLEIGTSTERGTYKIGVDGYLTVLFVAYDPEKRRYLALKRRAEHTDWTEAFSPPAGQTAAGTSSQQRATAGVLLTTGNFAAEPVDVVYTWVDSGDPAWQAAHQRYSGRYEVHNPSANNLERFIDREELRYSLRTLWMFAPFVRNIYLVTADQRPAWLADHPRVTVISHSEIFPDPEMLPTFNSHAIEACLHRIPGLAEHFIYMNDDVFLGREVRPAEFFTMAGLPKVRLSPSQYIYQGEPEPTAIPTDWAAYNAVSLIRRDFGLVFDRRVQHVPMALRRSVLQEIEQRYPDELERTRRARFRAVTDLAIPSMFGQFYGVATGQAVEWPAQRNEYIYLDTGRRDSLLRFHQIVRVRPRFFCLNVTRHAEIGLVEQARHVRDFLAPTFPDPAPWET